MLSGSVEILSRLCKTLFLGIKVPFEFESEFHLEGSDFCEHSHPLRGSLGRLVGPSLGEKVDRKPSITEWGSRDAPPGLPPPLGREGVTLITTTEDSRTLIDRGFQHSLLSIKSHP